MLVVLIVGLVLAGPAKREKRSKKSRRAERAGPRIPEGTGVDAHFLPELIGATETLQLEGLKRTSIRFTVDQDGAVLEQLGEDAIPALRRQLAADPRWRLTQLHGTWVATRRTEEGGEWTSGPEGYHLDLEHCWRIGVRLGPAGADYPWGESAAIDRQTADQRISLNWAVVLEQPPCRRQRAVALVVEAPALAVEILDSGDGEDLPVVVEGLQDLPIELANAAIDSGLIERRGFDASQLSSPVSDHPIAPTLTASDGGLELRATVHFDAPGLAWARVVRDGQPWEESTVGEATLEAPGWSAEPADHFPLQSRVPIRLDAPFEAELELWFQPEGGEPQRQWSGPVVVGS